jgi:plastocyanin
MSGNLKARTVLPSVLFIVLLVLLTACGSNGSSSTSGSSSTTAASTPSASSGDNSDGGRYGNYGTGAAKPTATTAVTGPTQTVTIKLVKGEFAFSPDSLTIAVGTTVIWENTTGAPHTVTSNDGKTFDSGTAQPVNPGSSFSFKFTKSGTYAYHCQFHPSMVATIIVK